MKRSKTFLFTDPMRFIITIIICAFICDSKLNGVFFACPIVLF